MFVVMAMTSTACGHLHSELQLIRGVQRNLIAEFQLAFGINHHEVMTAMEHMNRYRLEHQKRVFLMFVFVSCVSIMVMSTIVVVAAVVIMIFAVGVYVGVVVMIVTCMRIVIMSRMILDRFHRDSDPDHQVDIQLIV